MRKLALPLLLILFCSFYTTIPAQAISYERHPKLDYVAINNIVIEDREEEGFLKVENQDPVKIAGFADPGQTVKISFENQEYSTIADENGNWFVIFSIQNLKEGNYPLKVCFGDSENNESLIQLAVEGNTKVMSDSVVKKSDISEDIKELLPYVGGGMLFFLILISNGFYFSLKKVKHDN